MESFEKQYYEDLAFWEEGMLMDENNKLRFQLTVNLVPEDVKSLADIGCGNGIFLNFLHLNRNEIVLTGVDRSSTALGFVKFNKQIAEINALPFEDNSFDCVTCLEVIEHLPHQVYEKALSELTRISKKYVIISVPYNENVEDGYTKCPSCKSIFNSDLHLRNFQESEMSGLLMHTGFIEKKTQTFGDCFKFLGHDLFRKLFYPEQILQWQSPICPICGYTDNSKEVTTTNTSKESKKLITRFTSIPKLFWPKVKRHYWIMSLYEKNDTLHS
jgi:ubiquinone/menaquinone biosynthesis C-methylase UbiE